MDSKANGWPEGLPIPPKPALRLSDEDGNAFFIIGRAHRAAKKAGWSDAQVEAFCSIAMGSDYDRLLQTCMRYFDVS